MTTHATIRNEARTKGAQLAAARFYNQGDDPKTMADMRALLGSIRSPWPDDQFCMMVDDNMKTICEADFGPGSAKRLSDRPDGKR